MESKGRVERDLSGQVTTLETKGVVVVGAGPAGIVCALELANRGIEVVLLESGLDQFSNPIQELSELAEFDPRRQAPMSIASRRQFGGASVIWGGRCVPYDPIDFQQRPFVPFSDWPIKFDEVEKFHNRASEYFRTGTARFSTHQIESIKQKTITSKISDGNVLSSDLERWSLPTDFGREYKQQIKNNRLIRHMAGCTVTKLNFENDRDDVCSVAGVSSTGEPIRIVGSAFVLACGGLETTRLLMQPSDRFPNGTGNEGDWLGRCYMGHISGQIASVKFRGDPKQTQYGFLRDDDGVYLRQRFTFPATVQSENEINNIAIWLVNPKIGDSSHGNGVLSFAYLALCSPLGRFFAPDAI